MMFLRLPIVLRTTPAQCGGVAVHQSALARVPLAFFGTFKTSVWSWQPQEFLQVRAIPSVSCLLILCIQLA